MLYGYQIVDALKNVYMIRKLTVNLCSYDDEIVIPKKLPALYIINSDPSGVSETEHWFAVFVGQDKNVSYFDSFGIILNPVFTKINRWRGEFGEMVYNKKLIQNPFSNFCGVYCVCFGYWMTCGYGFGNFLDLFTHNLKSNDKLIEEFFSILIDNGN